MTTSQSQPQLNPEELRKALLAAVYKENGASIIWEFKILKKLSDKHWVTDKDFNDVLKNWEVLKSVTPEGKLWRYVVEGKNAAGDWMRAAVDIDLYPKVRVFPRSCYRCVKPKETNP